MEAAWALYQISKDADKHAAIVLAGGIAPLVALSRGGTGDQKPYAKLALWNLAMNNRPELWGFIS